MALKKCKECGNAVSGSAKTCPHCGAPVRGRGVISSLARLFVIVFIIIPVAIALFVSVYHSQSSSEAELQGAPNNSAPHAVAQGSQGTGTSATSSANIPTVGAQWDYTQQADPMSKGTTYFASVQSTNTVSFGFPYSGAQHATLTLRTHPRYGKDVILAIERGQFLCPSYDGCQVLVRFDDAAAIKYHAAGAADNSTETVFIRGYPAFLRHLEAAKVIRISANIYQEGAPAFEFNVAGFDAHKYIAASESK